MKRQSLFVAQRLRLLLRHHHSFLAATHVATTVDLVRTTPGCDVTTMPASGGKAGESDTVMPKGHQIQVALPPGQGRAGQEVRVIVPPESGGGFVTVKMPKGIKPGTCFYVRDNAAYLTPAEEEDEEMPSQGTHGTADDGGGAARLAASDPIGEGRDAQAAWTDPGHSTDDDGGGSRSSRGSRGDRRPPAPKVQNERQNNGPFEIPVVDEGGEAPSESNSGGFFGCGISLGCSPLFEAAGIDACTAVGPDDN
jgi:hypothetical protein